MPMNNVFKSGLVFVLIFFAVTVVACIQKEEPLPAIRVTLSYVHADGEYAVRILDAEPALVSGDEVSSIYEFPPVPGLHVYSFVFGKDRRFVTPVTFIPVDRVGENITVYVGFSGPDEVPLPGDTILVVAEVNIVVDGKVETVTMDRRYIEWDIEWRP